jgi:hypothetical protein
VRVQPIHRVELVALWQDLDGALDRLNVGVAHEHHQLLEGGAGRHEHRGEGVGPTVDDAEQRPDREREPKLEPVGAGAAASLYAVVKSVRAWAATASVTCCEPFTVPGGKPVTAVPGLKPRSPLTTVGAVFVTVEPARTAKGSAVPRGTDVAARALLADASATATASNSSGLLVQRRQERGGLPVTPNVDRELLDDVSDLGPCQVRWRGVVGFGGVQRASERGRARRSGRCEGRCATM